MYLFARRRRIEPGKGPEAMAWAIETADKVSQIGGIAVTAWSSMWGADAGTVVWSAFVQDLAELEQAGDKLAIDDGFNRRIADAEALFNGAVADSLSQVIHGARGTEPPGYVTVVTAQLANGRFTEGLAAVVEIAENVERITNTPTSVSLSVTGAYGGIAWLTGLRDIQALQATEAAINADTNFVALVDRVGSCFEPGAQQAIYRRLV
jgi:hypothetical protein